MMSTVPTTKWEANLHGANFWIHGCGGHSKVLQNTGLRIWMLELLYDKYCAPFDIPRVTLFYTCVWLKHYPHDALLPRYQPLHLPKIGVAPPMHACPIALCSIRLSCLISLGAPYGKRLFNIFVHTGPRRNSPPSRG